MSKDNPIPQHIKDKIESEATEMANMNRPLKEFYQSTRQRGFAESNNNSYQNGYSDGMKSGYQLAMEDNGWKEVSSGEFPEDGKKVEVYLSYGDVDISWRNSGGWYCSVGKLISVTHWRFLRPSPPSTKQVNS